MSTENTDVIVKTPLGQVRGTTSKSRKNQNVYAFRGIRYAKPPIGQQRFCPPIPIEPWTEIFDATKDGPVSPQPNPIPEIQDKIGEDCLHVNVFTKNPNGSLPVFVYIPGGIFESGGIHSDIYWGGQYLMDKDVVFVGINSRVGVLGLLSTGTEDAPGNNGLKDQVLALKWIHDNIQSFGGDPNNVTLCGHSSGATSITLHMVSPMSQGLFHRAILMGGTATHPSKSNNQKLTKLVAEHFGCPIDCPKRLVDCLRNIPVEKIMNVYTARDDGRYLKDVWGYEIEGDFGQERFMPEHPLKLFAEGKFAKIPILAGITKDELGTYLYADYQNDNEYFEDFNDNFNKIAPAHCHYNPNDIHITQALREFYFKKEKITKKHIEQVKNLLDDWMSYTMHTLLHLARRFTNVYYYRYDYIGRYSWVYGSNGKPVGVHHCDVLLYVFVHKIRGPMFRETDPENPMVEKMTEWFTTFARTGNPNNKSNPWTKDINWEPSNKDQVKALYINETCTLSDEPHKERCELWDRLFPIPYQVK